MASAATGPVMVGGTEVILLVEDDQRVRTLMRLVLGDRGYAVLEAAGGAQAIESARSTAKPIDLVVTDVVMPEMSGRDVAEQIKALYPDVKILFVSGYPDDIVGRPGVVEADVHFLQKPFTPQVLARKVRDVLDR